MNAGGLPCPHCTFLNLPNRRRCAVCLKALQKRGRPTDNEEGRSLTRGGVVSAASGRREEGETTGTDAVGRGDAEEVLAPPPTSSSDDVDNHSQERRKGARKEADPPPPALPSTQETSLEKVKPQRRSSLAADATGPGADGAPSAPRLVSCLFATAAGKPIEISEEQLKRAEEKYLLSEEEGAPGASPVSPEAQVATIFSTAAGKPVCVTEAALKDAARKLSQNQGDDTAEEGNSSNESHETTPDATGLASGQAPRRSGPVPDVGHMSTPSAGPRRFQPPRQRLMDDTKDRHDLVKIRDSVGGNSTGIRRGFVPPQQRLVVTESTKGCGAGQAADRFDRTITNLNQTLSGSATTPRSGGGRIASRPAQAAAKVKPLCFSPAAMPYQSECDRFERQVIPSIADIVRGEFYFRFLECSLPICGLMLPREPQTLSAPPPSRSSAVRDEHWHHLLLSLGAVPAHCTLYWCQQMIQSSLLQLRRMATEQGGDAGKSRGALLSPVALAMLLCLRYNYEFVDGNRPALRKLVEGDIPPASLMVVDVVEVCEERAAPHIRVVRVSDGFYAMKASLDVPLSSLVREGVLAAGRRLSVCGAKLLLHAQCTPEECGSERTVMSLHYNCVRPVAAGTPLGLGVGEPAPLPIRLVHPLGGLVPALEGTVARVLPPFYVSQPLAPGDAQKTGAAVPRAARVLRNRQAQMAHYSRLARQLDSGGQALGVRERSAEAGDAEAARARGENREPQRVSRVRSLLLRSVPAVYDSGGTGETQAWDALIQHWDSCDDEVACARGAAMDDGVDDVGLPEEGSRIVVYALNPAKSQTAGAPFSQAKLFFASRALHFSPVMEQGKADRSSRDVGRRVYQSLVNTPSLSLGGAVDVLGLCLGSVSAPQGQLHLLLMGDGGYALFQVPLPSSSRELSFHVPQTEHPFLLLVQNATFISHEDSQAGSDCARVFANEYTTTSLRVKHVPGTPAAQIEDARIALTLLFKTAERKHRARCEEILRCCAEEATPSVLGGGAHSTARLGPSIGGAALVDTEGESYGRGCATSVDLRGGASLVAAKRLPYYLRGQPSGDDSPQNAKRCGGVVLTRCGGPSVSGGAPVAVPTYHYYGNVTHLDVMTRAEGRLVLSPLFREGSRAPNGFFQPGQHAPGAFVGVQVTWRYGAANETCTAAIQDGQTLDALLEVCVSAQRVRYLCGGGACSAASPKLMASSCEERDGCLSPSANGAWWTLLQTAAVSAPQAVANGHAFPHVMTWTAEEWAAALRMVSDKLTFVLFKFTLHRDDTSVLAKVFHLKDNCPVADLFP